MKEKHWSQTLVFHPSQPLFARHRLLMSRGEKVHNHNSAPSPQTGGARSAPFNGSQAYIRESKCLTAVQLCVCVCTLACITALP